LYTNAGKKIKSIPYTTIIGNPDYNPEENNTYVFSCVTPKGNTQYFYTEEAVKGWREERFEAVDNFTPMIAEVRADWLKRIRSRNLKEQRLAILLEMLYWCSARIGSANNEAAGVKTFGISTLRGQHVRLLSNKLVVEYIGKTGVKQKHVLLPVTPAQKYIVKTLMQWKEEGGRDGVLFDLKGNYEVPPSNGTVNTFFRACGAPSDVSVHKLRHAQATSMMMKRILKVLNPSLKKKY
jgi:DNA topoisomerase IB